MLSHLAGLEHTFLKEICLPDVVHVVQQWLSSTGKAENPLVVQYIRVDALAVPI